MHASQRWKSPRLESNTTNALASLCAAHHPLFQAQIAALSTSSVDYLSSLPFRTQQRHLHHHLATCSSPPRPGYRTPDPSTHAPTGAQSPLCAVQQGPPSSTLHCPVPFISFPSKLYLTIMSDSSRRPTPRMPAGASTLSERIASLQRKASESGAAGESSRPTSPLVRTGRVASEAAAAPRQMSSPAGSSSDIFPRGSAPAAGSSQAVRDRIARFQQNGGDPLIPRSSFGAPAPNPEERGKAVKAYPAAGGWAGESPSLRPQMTGGWGGSSAGGVGRSLMPQATGPITWAGQRRQGE